MSGQEPNYSPLEVLADENEQSEAKKIYEIWFLSRPPFSYSIEDPAYKGIEKGSVYALEAKAFNADQIITPPDPSESVLVEAFTKIQSYGKDLRENIETIKKNSQAPNNKKELYKNHHDLKKLFFQSIMIYLRLWMKKERDGGNSQTQKYQDYEMLFHQVESIHLAHQSYTTVLTFVHDFEPLRESGDLVMDHAYNICIRGMNKYLKKIFAEKDLLKRVALYHRMKKSIVVRLCHDMGEDFRKQWSSKVFQETIRRIAGGFDSRILNLLFKEDDETIDDDVENPHFISEEWPSIERMINALTKPKNKADRKGYMRRQTLENQELTEEELEDVVDIKSDDRLDNLTTLKYMKGKPNEGETRVQTQLRKIEETLEILEINKDYCKRRPNHCELIEENSKDLVEACLNELHRLQTEGQLESDGIIKKIQLKKQFKAIETELNTQKKAT